MELWDLSTTNATFLRDVSSLDDAARYQSCVTESVGSVALKDSRLSTFTVAYYTGITPGSRACFDSTARLRIPRLPEIYWNPLR